MRMLPGYAGKYLDDTNPLVFVSFSGSDCLGIKCSCITGYTHKHLGGKTPFTPLSLTQGLHALRQTITGFIYPFVSLQVIQRG